MNLYLSGGGSCGTGSESRNNLFYGSGGTINCGTASNNVTTTTAAFVNFANKDFHIVSTTGSSFPRNAGIDLSTKFTTDMDRTMFNADGTWDVGAYAYNSGGVSQPPATTTSLAAPSSLTATPTTP